MSLTLTTQDDFSSVLRRWKLSWGGLSFVPRVKASLMLSYDFLRLYINAFAFQANLNRIVRHPKKRPAGSLFSELASAPDARFIYESIDAANSILCTINSFIDPTTVFKYMPIKFYLYVIYAAVFLFKVLYNWISFSCPQILTILFLGYLCRGYQTIRSTRRSSCHIRNYITSTENFG